MRPQHQLEINMNNVIELHPNTTPTAQVENTQDQSCLFDLGGVSVEALHTIAQAMLQTHCYCPEPISFALEQHAVRHEKSAADYESKVKHPDKNAKLDELVNRAFANPKRAGKFIRDVGYPDDIPKHLWFVEGEFKSPEAAKLWPEIYNHIYELADDRAHRSEANYHRQLAAGIRIANANYKAGRLIIETKNGKRVIMCTRKTAEETEAYSALQRLGLV